MNHFSWIKIRQILLIFALLFIPFASDAEEDEADKGAEKEALMYYAVEPNVLTFYQGTGRKLGYVVVEVNIVVRGESNYDLVDLHLPLIQDSLIDFFNKQDKSVIQPFSEREKLRVAAKERVAEVLKEEIGKDVVEDLLFTNYVFQ